MWSHVFNDRVLCLSSNGDHIAFGCENGWIYLFDKNGLVWSKKLISTYYRGPFTDVNVISIDVSDGFVVAGTDFADGKVHLFHLNGKKVWERQLMSYLGCWERPEDIKTLKISGENIAAVSGFMEDKLYILSLDGDVSSIESFGEFIRCMDFQEIVALGGERRSYIYDGSIRSYDFPSKNVIVVDDWAMFVKDDGVYSTLGWTFDAKDPRVSANSEIVVVSSGNRIYEFTPDGRKVGERTFDGNVLDIRVIGDSVVVATPKRVYIDEDVLEIEKVFRICDGGLLLRDGNVYRYIEFP